MSINIKLKQLTNGMQYQPIEIIQKRYNQPMESNAQATNSRQK